MLFDARSFFQKEKQIDRHQNKTQHESGESEKAADAGLDQVPKFFGQSRQITFEIGDELVDVGLKALSVGRRQFRRCGRDYFNRRSSRFWTGRRGSSRSRRWLRVWRRRTQEPIHEPGRWRSGSSPAGSRINSAIVPRDKIDNFFPCLLRVTGKFLGKARTLHRDHWHDPGTESDQREEDEGKEERNRLGATEATLAHSGDQWVKEIRKNGRNRDRNQDGLEKTDEVSEHPNSRPHYDDEKEDERSAESGPHRLALPGRRISLSRCAHDIASRKMTEAPPIILMMRFGARGITFTHFGLHIVDLLREIFILRIERARFLPCLKRLRSPVQLRIGVADMFKNHRVIARHVLRRPL